MLDPELVEFFNNFKEEMKDEMNSSISSLRDEMNSNYSALEDKIDSNYSALNDKIDFNYSALEDKIDSNYSSLDDKINSSNKSIWKELSLIRKETAALREDVDTINIRLTSLEHTCTVIEKEHGDKLDLLLDYAAANIEKHKEYDKKFEEVDRRLFIHDAKLANIEGSDFYKKNIKGKEKSNLRNAIL